MRLTLDKGSALVSAWAAAHADREHVTREKGSEEPVPFVLNNAAARESNYEAANRLRDFYDKIDAAVDDMDDAADTLLIDILSTDAQSC